MTMHKIVLFCKSYINDLPRVVNLIQSINTFNKDNIPVYISVPSVDYPIFKKNLGNTGVNLFKDEDIANELITQKVNAFSIGYINQQIVKLSFWKTNICENYFCMDSDGYFIRDFFKSDFMLNENTPYTILVQDKDLCVEPKYHHYYDSRLEKLKIIQESLNFSDVRFATCHNFAILSRQVLKTFEDKFLIPHGLKYYDILKDASYEFSWYNTWLQKDKTIEIVPIEPLFKMFHYSDQYFDYLRRNVSEHDIARAYIGICINSNWSNKYNSASNKYGDLRIRLAKRIYENITEHFLNAMKRMLS